MALEVPLHAHVKSLVIKALNEALRVEKHPGIPVEGGVFKPRYSFKELVEAGIWKFNEYTSRPETPAEAHAFFETYSARREAALDLWRRCVDHWIDSGASGRWERAMDRTYSAEALENITRLWNESQIAYKVTPTTTGPQNISVTLLPPGNEAADFESAVWSARYCIWIVLCTDLRFEIARCRWSECGEYFPLTKRQSQLRFTRGTFCSKGHRHQAAINNDRVKTRSVRMRLAAEYVAARWKGAPAGWFADVPFKLKLLTHINAKQSTKAETIHQKWITIHQVEIDAKAAEIRRGT